jgi:ABC-type dipeptide/oligopeptide/nickel transport system permease subunit
VSKRLSWANSWPARIGLLGTVVMLLIAFLGPFLAPHSPTALLGAPLSPPSSEFPLGTDFLGRDVLSRVLWGGHTVIILAGIATVASYVVGASIGLWAGFSRSLVDGVLMRGVDLLLAFPPILLLLLLAAGFGAAPAALVVGIVLVHVPGIARIVRAAAQEQSTRGYVEAAVARGEHAPQILFREILPNIWPTIAADIGPRFTVSILLVAAINFLGLGLRPPTADWALMISENSTALTIQPLTILVPALMIAVLTISVNLVADAFARSRGVSRTMVVVQR